MPTTTTNTTSGAGSAMVVRRFYDAITRKDAEAIRAVIEECFDSEARLVLPESLPYGGAHQGASRLSRMFAGMAKTQGAGGPGDLALTEVIDDGEKVVAHLSFTWTAPGASSSIPHEALEIWTFVEGKATEIRGFYWDTHACAEQVASVRS